ncbi:MAG: ankyrin repeat domain-containing protein [Epsilonproteobacteria bacterium]|nr:ankyrin repeat domain-containing protein [Campylobacterota bacterium]
MKKYLVFCLLSVLLSLRVLVCAEPKQGQEVNNVYKGGTALHLAAGGDDIRVLFTLLNDQEIDKNAVTDDFRWTAVHVAASKNKPENIKELLSYQWFAKGKGSGVTQKFRFDPNAVDCRGNTPLHIAAQLGHFEAYQALVEQGAKQDIKNNAQKLPIDLAQDRVNADKANVEGWAKNQDFEFFVKRYQGCLVIVATYGKEL